MAENNEQSLRHIAIIMDGNGRWAQARGLPRLEGHRQGMRQVRTITKAIFKKNIPFLTLYAFSTENWSRPQQEVSGLMHLCSFFVKKYIKNLLEEGVCLQVLGNLERLPTTTRKDLEKAIEATHKAGPNHLCLAFNYGAREEVLRAVESCRGIPGPLTWDTFSDHLYTGGIPDPDLIIRTSGEQRLSNFLLLQAAYSEFYFTPILWPDFTEVELDKAIEDFYRRQRRYGN